MQGVIKWIAWQVGRPEYAADWFVKALLRH